MRPVTTLNSSSLFSSLPLPLYILPTSSDELYYFIPYVYCICRQWRNKPSKSRCKYFESSKKNNVIKGLIVRLFKKDLEIAVVVEGENDRIVECRS